MNVSKNVYICVKEKYGNKSTYRGGEIRGQ